MVDWPGPTKVGASRREREKSRSLFFYWACWASMPDTSLVHLPLMPKEFDAIYKVGYDAGYQAGYVQGRNSMKLEQTVPKQVEIIEADEELAREHLVQPGTRIRVIRMMDGTRHTIVEDTDEKAG